MLIIDLEKIKSVCSEARRLMKQGVPDQPFEGWRNGMKCLTGKSLARVAALTVREEPCLHYAKYEDVGARLGKRKDPASD